MPPGSGVIVEGTGNTKNEKPELEKSDQDVDIKVQIIFSSISYTKFLKQKEKSSTYISSKKGGNASDYFLYCSEDWPAEAHLYNDPCDEIIFIDCGSDDFGSATKNSKDEKVLRKYISFAIMRLKDMLYRRSRMHHQHGQVHCMILSIFPFHKCMIAMSALLGKVLSDGDIYISFIADVGSRPEYRYTFKWIRSYGWSFEVYYNAALNPYKGSVGCSSSPKMKLQEIDKLLCATTGFNASWIPGNSGMPAPPYWVDKHYKEDDNGNVTYGGKGASEQPVVFYDRREKEATTREGEEIEVTEWVPQEKATKVWVPDDPSVKKWQDPNTGRCLVRYNGEIYDRDYLYDYWKQAVHPTNDQLKQRIDDAHKRYDEASKRSDELFARAVDAQEAGDSQYTEEYINKEVDNLVKKTGMTREKAKEALAEQGFIPMNNKGETMYFLDGRMMTNDGLVEMVNAANEAAMKALKDYLNAQSALEQKKVSDILFCLNVASLVVGVVSFGATSVVAAGVFAMVDLSLNVMIVEFQIKGALIEGKSAMSAFGDSTGERIFNIAVTGVAIVADIFSIVPLFKGPKGIPKPTGGAQHAVVSQPSAPTMHPQTSTPTAHPQTSTPAPEIKKSAPEVNAKVKEEPKLVNRESTGGKLKRDESGNLTPEFEWKEFTETYSDGSVWKVKKDGSNNKVIERVQTKGPDVKPTPVKNESLPAASEPPKIKDIEVTNAKGEKEFRTQVTHEDGRVDVYTRDKNENLISVDSTNPQNPGEYTHSEQFHANGKPKSTDVIKDNQVTRTDYFNDKGEFIESDININESNSSIDDIINGVDDYLGSKIGSKPNPNSQIEIKGVDVNTGISLKGEKIHEHVFEVTDKSPISSPEATVKGQEQPSGTNAANANNADTPMPRDANAIEEVAKDGDGVVASNTGNADKLVEDIKKGMRKSFSEPIGGMKDAYQAFKAEEIDGGKFAKKITVNIAKLFAGLDHWLCIGVAIYNLNDIESKDFSTEEEIELDERPIDTSDEFESVNAELHEIKNPGEIGDLTGVDPKSLDAGAIANHSQEVLDSLKDYEIIDDANLDYEEMNTAANNVIAAENKVAAAKEYVKTGEDMEGIIKEYVEPGGDLDGEIPIDAFEDDRYASLYDYRTYLSQNVLDPDNTTFNENSIVDIAEAELEGAQVDLLLQQVIQKDKDNKLKEDE